MSFIACINKDVIGCIMRYCKHADQIALARTCSLAKRAFLQYAHENRPEIVKYACERDEVGLFKLTYIAADMESCWVWVVEFCSDGIMSFLLRRCNPNWNKCYALMRLVRSKHKNAIKTLCVLLADPMTHDSPSFAIDMASWSANVDAMKILINDDRFLEVWPEVGWLAAIKHDISDACEHMVAKHPMYCDAYIKKAAQLGKYMLVRCMRVHVNTCMLKNLCNDLTIPYREMMLLMKELIRRAL